MKDKSIIGITTSGGATCRVNKRYVESVTMAGGTPLLLAPIDSSEQIRELVGLCDGILLTGGADVSPECYGEEKLEVCGNACEERDRFEIALVREALEKDIAVFGICRGSQLLNVALGGSLWQDIPSQLPNSICHRATDENPAEHNVILTDEGFCRKIGFSSEQFAVNSYHHQAVKELGKGLEILAKAEGDGMVEGVYMPSRNFVVAVQWHPELWTDKDANAMALFKAFVESSKF